jgi:hypothetical protein
VFVVRASPNLRVVVRVLRRPTKKLTVPGALVVAICEPFVTDPRAKIDLRGAKQIAIATATGDGVRMLFHVPPAFPQELKATITRLGRMLPSSREKRLEAEYVSLWADLGASAREEWTARTRVPHEKARGRDNPQRAPPVDGRVLAEIAARDLDQVGGAANVKAARRLLQQAAKRLAAPGPTSVDDRWRVLQKCVEGLNALDERKSFIDTTAREQLCERIAALAEAAGLPSAEAENAVDRWRDW